MKKSALFLGLLAITSLCLTACGSKTYTMSFDKAVETANHSALQDILTNSENVQQVFNLSTNIDNGSNKMAISLQSDSKQNLGNNKSESSTTFDVEVKAEDTNVLIKGALDVKLLDNTIYLNLTSLDFSGPEDTSFLAAMTDGFKNQRFSIPMGGVNNMPSTFSYIKDAKSLNEQAKKVIINEGSVIYNGKFTQFNGYNAWKFSLDTKKLQELINDYYAKLNESLEEDIQEVPQLNIQNFEGYLVVTGKDKVTTVIDNMDMVQEDTTMNINGFGGEDYEINALTNGEPLLTMKAIKKSSNYNLSMNVADSVKLEGTITPKTSSSKIDVKFDATLTIKPEYEESDDTVLPLKGSWSYNPISDFNVTAPENAQDLTEMLSAYLGSMLGTGDYGYGYDEYEDGLDIEENYIEDLAEIDEENTEVVETE